MLMLVGYDTPMNSLLEWSPVAAFFVVYKLLGIYWATAVLMVCYVALMLIHRLRSGHFKPMHVVAASVALVLGTATLLFHDKRFIQWKATVLLAAAALTFVVSTFVGKRPLARRLLETAFEEPLDVADSTWRGITLLWAAFFALLAGANLYVARNFSENAWVNFKFIGVPVALMVFMLPQVFWLAGKVKPKPVEHA
jgi:intracellular septation protein